MVGNGDAKENQRGPMMIPTTNEAARATATGLGGRRREASVAVPRSAALFLEFRL